MPPPEKKKETYKGSALLLSSAVSGLPLLGPTEALAHRNGRFSLSLSHTHVHARLVCLHKKNRKGWANNEINGVVRFRFLCRGRVGRRGGSSTHAKVNAEHAFTRSRKTLFARTVKRDAQWVLDLS